MKEPQYLAFVCLHGSAKSLIAAEHMNGLARSCGVAVEATTSGPEPDAEVPANVIDGLLTRAAQLSRVAFRDELFIRVRREHGLDAFPEILERRLLAQRLPCLAPWRPPASQARRGLGLPARGFRRGRR